MSTAPSDRELWEAFVQAERELHRRQAAFFQDVQDRLEILRAALTEGGWEQATALSFLGTFSGDGQELLPQLVALSMSDALALAARRAIGRIPRDRLEPLLAPLIMDELDSADCDDFRRLAELLAHIGAWRLLEQLVHRARANGDPDFREVAEDFTDEYGPMWLPRPRGMSRNP
ncbi:hypothetical protein [Actinomadura sp. K4S16]|uniref:hypothetical protein n=1 Tax=Actinomadura sp. K4S16 TaxID=1316147 RepID=UPI0011EF2D73|nr:hypothetical protein [Actinomadura sp. K4S16]